MLFLKGKGEKMGGGMSSVGRQEESLKFLEDFESFFFGGGLLLIQSLTVTQNPPASAS